MSGWTQDLRFAFRSLRHRPGFTAVAVLTLALGLGATSGLFAVVDAVVLRPLPYPAADRLVALWTEFDNQGDARFGASLAETYDYAAETRAFEAMGSFVQTGATLTGSGPAARVAVAYTWGDLFGVTGIGVQQGRLPGPDEARSGASPVAVVSADFWRSVMAGSSSVVGSTVELGGTTVEIVGVLDDDARLPEGGADLWLPFAVDRADIVDRSGHSLDVIARLAPGATLADARREMEAIEARWNERFAGVHSPGHSGHGFGMAELHERYYGPLRSAGLLLLGAVTLLLLLACANVAGLLLARGEARQAELSVRQALGAGRGRLLRQLLIESVVLAVLGGAAGLLLAWWGTDALMALEPGNLPRTDAVALDGRVLAFTAAATLVSSVLFGLLPALRGSGSASPAAGARGSLGPDRRLSRSLSTLVVGQLGFAVVLLVGAGLLAQSLGALARADAGLATSGRLTVELALAQPRYPEMADVTGFWTGLVSEVEALPGVEGAAVTRQLPLRDGLRREVMRIAGRAADTDDGALAVAFQAVSPGWFELMEIPVLEGRAFDPSDGLGASWVAVVNEAAARAYWPDGSPLGARVRPLWAAEELGDATVVGVVANVMSEGVREAPTPELYLAYGQVPPNVSGYARNGTLVVRTRIAPTALAGPIRQVVEAIDPEVPLVDVRTFDQVSADARARERFVTTVLAVFALVAVLIAAVGTFGVVTFVAARRTREFGLRVALGARRERLIAEVLRGGLRMALWGGGVGAIAALVAAPLLERFLFGVGVHDPLALVSGPAVVLLVVLIASVVPALRAGSIQPVEALRDEG